jgi:hypothetical protein
MGLLSSKSLRQVAIGAGSRLLSRMDEARQSGEQGLEELKIARKEVDEEVANIKKTYDSALTVGSSVGGGTFANFLFGTNDIEYISALGQMAPDNRNDAISELKKNFELLPEEEKTKFEDYTKVSQQKFSSDINASKIKNGLEIKNNMGKNTTNFLSKLMFEPPKDVRERQEAVVSGFTPPEMEAPTPVVGAYEAIRPSTSAITIDQGDILSYLKNTIETLGFNQKEIRTGFENDYNTLITGTPEDKAKVVQKYYYPVYQTKMPVYPTQKVTGQQDEEEESYLDILEDINPNYSG